MKKILLFIIISISLLSCSFEQGYVVEDGKVYFEKPNVKDFIYNKGRERITDADISTFEILEKGHYAKDRKNAYYEAEIIEEADPATFEALGKMIARDKNSGFFEERKIQDSDGKTFQLITGLYSKDKDRAYYCEDSIAGSDVNSFEVVDKENRVSKDKNGYYRSERKLPIKDPATFTKIKDDFWKDQYYVYDISKIYGHNSEIVLEGVDPKTVKAVFGRNGLLKDKYGCHNGYERVDCD